MGFAKDPESGDREHLNPLHGGMGISEALRIIRQLPDDMFDRIDDDGPPQARNISVRRFLRMVVRRHAGNWAK
jgi:hypothetical protein